MKSHKNKVKKAGFGARLTAAILFVFAALFMVLSAGMSTIDGYSETFLKWLAYRGYGESFQGDNLRFDSDKEYDDWYFIHIAFSTYHGSHAAESGYIQIDYRVVTDEIWYTDEETGEVFYVIESLTDVYHFVSEDTEAKTATYESERGEYMTVYYGNWTSYSDFLESGGWTAEGTFEMLITFGIIAIVMAVLAILMFVCASAGKKHKWANVTSIIIGAPTCIILIGIFAVVGGAKGLKSLKESEPKSKPAPAETVFAEPVHSKSTTESTKAPPDYPVDYENKPTVSQVLDSENTENLVLAGQNGEEIEFKQLYTNVHEGKLYFIAEPINYDGNIGAVVFRVNYDNDNFTVEEDDDICQALWNEYNSALHNSQYQHQSISRADFRLDLYDTSIDEGTWKSFKKTASQDELTVLAIGAKYRITHSRIKNIIYAIGIILSIAIFWPTGGWSLIGYPIFAFLATKSIRYQDTFGQTYRKLSKENKAFVDGFYKSNVGLTILDGIITIATLWLTLPYQAIMLLIGTFAPNFVIAKNGILVSIPNGFDVGNLGAVGAYYASFDFTDEVLAGKSGKSQSESTSSPTDDYYKEDEHSYVDSHGYTQTIYTDHGGSEAHDAGGRYVGEVSDDKFTPANQNDNTDK